MQDEIVFRFVDEGVAASARLLREWAPETCGAVADTLPAVGIAQHGIYSGSEVYLVLPVLLRPPREHATTIVGRGARDRPRRDVASFGRSWGPGEGKG